MRIRILTPTQRFVRELRRLGVDVRTHRGYGSKFRDLYRLRRKVKHHSLIPVRPVDTLWQHISVTRPTDTPGKDFRAIEQIGYDRFGTGASYNVMVHPTGVVGIGQPLDAKGAHTLNDKGIPNYAFNQNAVSLAVAYIGMDGQDFTEAAQWATARVIAALVNVGYLTPGFDYNPHRMVAPKSCPTDKVVNRMPNVRSTAISITTAGKRKGK